MSKSIGFFYDFVSPYSYLAFVQLQRLAERTGVAIEYRPIDVIALMGRVGNRPTTVECAAKGRYAMADLGRWARRLKVPLVPNPHFRKIDKRPLLLGAIAAASTGQAAAYNLAVFQGVWVKQSGFATPGETLTLLEAAGIADVAQIMAKAAGLTDALEANLAEAEANGLFGTPSFTLDGQLYFGNDRVMFLEEALAA